ncbi:protein SPA1-RELATED 3 isoform X1 [Tripterygium wilfordii]|uniref:protein SPA1-RELATED 3 isoform X1 n=2 Tax=Tripterygium wilfordii TaxID=458696 RepID=UPI0018F83DDA|nr:protein SPA1-RELATED 3 isoform X1 [Tripterygium wilfordii]XP_038689650.1 protein SPA1-RELATED 3 isoform X1 [Tripterygium wilfordii]
MCIFWPSFKPRGITMEGSSESAWQNSDSSRGLNTSGVSDRNLVRPPQDKESDRVLLAHNDPLRNQIDSSRLFEDEAAAEPFGHDVEWGDVSLRQWLDRPERSVDVFECKHIFRQIVEIVNAAHSQGVVVHNVRPSCFVMSSFSRVSFIESASCSDSGSDSLEDELNNQTMEVKEPFSPSHMRQQRSRLGVEDFTAEPDRTGAFSEASCMQSSSAYAMNASLAEDALVNRIRDWRNVEQVDEQKQSFPMKQILLLETNWYTSPEELTGAPSSCASDIYRLGVLLFELFCPFCSREEKSRTMSSLRHRVLPPQLLLRWPKEASFCLWLLHPEPTSRPKMSELLQSEFLNEPRDNLEERQAAIELRETIEEQELLLEFLMLIKQRKQEAADKLEDTVSFLCSDIEEVIGLLKFLKKKRGSCTEQGKDDYLMSKFPSSETGDDGGFASLGSRKRFRAGVNMEVIEDCDDNLEDAQNSDALVTQEQESILLKSSRLMKNFKKLEAAYFLTRCRPIKASRKPLNVHSPMSSDGRGSVVVTERSSVSNLASKEQYSSKQSGWITPFVEGLCKYLSFSKLRVKADLKQVDLLNSSNLVCSLSFDRDGEFFATAGVNKKIKVFECDTIMNETHDIHYPVVEMSSRSKLSSICWNSYIKSQIASSNFEGVVQVWDVTRSQVLTEMREHERRVWSIDFSSADPTMLASGSDDGCVKLWSINQGVSIGTIKTKANVCCVQFPMDSSRNLAFGSADHKIYYYDLRNSRAPLCTLVGHNKTVSYVKFVDVENLVSASTDNTLKLWDLSLSTSRVIDTPLQSFTGHVNVKNFVGLSVSDGYIATGSETNEVFIYHKAFPMPALSFKFQSTDPLSGLETDDAAQFISSVCWRNHSSTLVAANSTGNIKVLEMV